MIQTIKIIELDEVVDIIEIDCDQKHPSEIINECHICGLPTYLEDWDECGEPVSASYECSNCYQNQSKYEEWIKW